MPLPFRLRVGTAWALDMDSAKVWLRNQTSVPEGTDFGDATRLLRTDPRFTDAFVLVQCAGKGDGHDYTTVLHHINELVVAYGEASGVMFGATALRQLTLSDVFFTNYWQLRVQAAPNEALDDVAEEVLGLRLYRSESTLGQMTGALDDLPGGILELIAEQVRKGRDHLYYEWSFEAKSKMVSGDSVGALLMAVAALEGAHSAFVRGRLSQQLPKDSDKSLPAEFRSGTGDDPLQQADALPVPR